MKKCALILCIVSALTGKASPPGYVHVSGGKLISGSGTEVKLNGINLGGWLLWEAWIWGGGFNKESKIYSKLEEIVGKEEAQKFRQSVYEKFITEKDIKRISQLCLNTVRVPINHALLEDDAIPYKYREEGWKILDSLISWCEKYKVYVVLDLHSAPGGQNNYFISDPDQDKLWDVEENKKRTIALWKAIAERYATRTIIAGYDLLNEPSVSKPADLVNLYDNIATEIRKVDQNHLLILEGNKLAVDFDFFTAVKDSNTIFSFHFYTFLVKKKQERLSKFNDIAKKFNRPLWCGEWGESKIDDMKENRQMLESSQFNFCGQCAWTWKQVQKNDKSAAFVKISISEEWKQLMNFVTGFGKRPKHDDVIKAMKDFLKAIEYDKPYEIPAQMEIIKRCTEM